ncbi:MAG TPA: 2-amino-4-hydroxy-6-hydroxymethyldihydropteridine diphosphokinase [Rhodocyclaceae bacterium]|nr:2-amino-4-hydroxy-6-hydroxymethyldihydropteridine diphosphokinase [Rhodocyclaceae bacterium]
MAYVALGANLGAPIETVKQAVEALNALPSSTVVAVSSLYRTAPVGLHDQPDFINAVAALETELMPLALLEELFSIEARFGRQRSVRNAPRTLDLDLLLHGNTISDDPQVTLPHPRMHERAFVLMPLHEIAPALSIPGHCAVADLLPACADQGIVKL